MTVAFLLTLLACTINFVVAYIGGWLINLAFNSINTTICWFLASIFAVFYAFFVDKIIDWFYHWECSDWSVFDNKKLHFWYILGSNIIRTASLFYLILLYYPTVGLFLSHHL